jgi:hypothetical protein
MAKIHLKISVICTNEKDIDFARNGVAIHG